jgi:hypothetical protein
MAIGTDNIIYYAPGSAAFDYSSSEGAAGEMAAYMVSFDPAKGARRTPRCEQRRPARACSYFG